jgi:uncharacterized OsmC-like protein
MGRLHVTYDGDQHATAVKEPHHNTVAIDCPFTGKGEEFSPASLLGVSLASCMLLSMGSIAKHHNLDLTDTVVDIELEGMNKTFPHVDTITLAFKIPRDFSASDRKTLERAACICPIMGSFCEDTAVATTYDYGDATEVRATSRPISKSFL